MTARAKAKRPGRAEAAADALARLAGFGGWVDPAVSLAGVPERVLAALFAAGAIEVWPGWGLVRATAQAAPAALPQQAAA
jgi:hypothetical protein